MDQNQMQIIEEKKKNLLQNLRNQRQQRTQNTQQSNQQFENYLENQQNENQNQNTTSYDDIQENQDYLEQQQYNQLQNQNLFHQQQDFNDYQYQDNLNDQQYMDENQNVQLQNQENNNNNQIKITENLQSEKQKAVLDKQQYYEQQLFQQKQLLLQKQEQLYPNVLQQQQEEEQQDRYQQDYDIQENYDDQQYQQENNDIEYNENDFQSVKDSNSSNQNNSYSNNQQQNINLEQIQQQQIQEQELEEQLYYQQLQDQKNFQQQQEQQYQQEDQEYIQQQNNFQYKQQEEEYNETYSNDDDNNNSDNDQQFNEFNQPQLTQTQKELLNLGKIETKSKIEQNQQIVNNFYSTLSNKQKNEINKEKKLQDKLYNEIKLKYGKQLNKNKKNTSKSKSPKTKYNYHQNCKQNKDQQLNPNKKQLLTKHDRIQAQERLLRNPNEEYERRQQIKEYNENKQLEQQCTFNPQPLPQSQRITMVNYPDIPVEEKLKQDGQMKEKKIQYMARQQEFKQMQECHFQPEINYTSDLINQKNERKPLVERVIEIEKNKENKIESKRMEIDDQLKTQFQPKISEASKFLAKIRYQQEMDDDSQNLTVLSRVQQEAENIKQKKLIQKNKYLFQEMQECQFQPNCNISQKETTKILQKVPIYAENISFEDRQFLIQRYYEQKKQDYAYHKQQEECPFNPQVDRVSQMLFYSEENNLKKSVFERLKEKDEIKKQKIAEKKQEQESQYKFKPKINPNSNILTLDRNCSPSTMTYNAEGKIRKQLLLQEYEFKDMEECSFYPTTQATSKYAESMNITSYYTKDDIQDSIATHNYIKKSQYNQKKKESLNKELDGCTFQPKINKSVNISKTKPVEQQVKGLENYLRNRDQVEVKKAKQKQAEQKAFNHIQKYDKRIQQEQQNKPNFIKKNQDNLTNIFLKAQNKK